MSPVRDTNGSSGSSGSVSTRRTRTPSTGAVLAALRRARQLARHPDSEPVQPVPPVRQPEQDPDQAWKTLELTIRFISHADGKAGLTLAGAGVVGGVLYSVAQNTHQAGLALSAAITTCGALILVSSLFSALSLWPRSRPASAAGAIYFMHIAQRYPRPDDMPAYVARLQELTGDPDGLIREIGAQIWANSHVAARKFRWANLAVGALALAFAALGVIGALSVH